MHSFVGIDGILVLKSGADLPSSSDLMWALYFAFTFCLHHSLFVNLRLYINVCFYCVNSTVACVMASSPVIKFGGSGLEDYASITD